MIGWIRGGVLLAVCLAGGCGVLPASMDLITLARDGIADAQVAEAEHYAQQQQWLAERQSQLADAFDRDVRQVAAGHLVRADGSAVAFDAQWVIDARRGYDAAGAALWTQAVDDMQAHQTRLDNLAATDEALTRAHDLLLGRWTLLQALRPQAWLTGGINHGQ
jgi:hypothetical protein